MKTDKTQMPEYSNDGVGRLNKHAYRDGYIHGTNLDDYMQQEDSSLPSNIGEKNRLSKGLLLGLTLTTLIGLIGGTSFLWTYHYLQSPTPVNTEHVPAK